jgi:hypothetical protein
MRFIFLSRAVESLALGSLVRLEEQEENVKGML